MNVRDIAARLAPAAPAAAGRPPHDECGDPTPNPGVIQAGAPTYFRTNDQVTAAMKELAAKYPGLVQLTDIGDSGDKTRGTADRDIWQLTLTNKSANQGRKAGVFYVGGTHAREIANPELLMKWANELLSGYGTDAKATALLDTREIRIVPIMNPDGHAIVERGYLTLSSRDLWQRKNTTPFKGGTGTDLNRNYDFKWGGPGASSSPGSDTYRGPSAASESETQAVQAAVLSSKPGVFIDWHSYSRLNLYPWGDTERPAPDAAGLRALATKFSTYNRYTPQQAIDLYPTSGTSHDFGYGRTGMPSFVVETGDSFHQSDKEFEESYRLNKPVMEYATSVADAPFQRVLGPDADSVTVQSAAGAASLTASVTSTNTSKLKISGAEWTVDPFATPGSGTSLDAADGAFDSPTEQVRGQVAADAAAGARLVYVRARDEAGNWGPLTPQWLTAAR